MKIEFCAKHKPTGELKKRMDKCPGCWCERTRRHEQDRIRRYIMAIQTHYDFGEQDYAIPLLEQILREVNIDIKE